MRRFIMLFAGMSQIVTTEDDVNLVSDFANGRTQHQIKLEDLKLKWSPSKGMVYQKVEVMDVLT